MSTYAQLRLAAEAYAVPIGNVVEIAILGDLTTVPGARPEILGVRNLRGQILPVIDLAQLLGLNPVTPPRQLLVAESGSVRQASRSMKFATSENSPTPARALSRTSCSGP